MTLAALERLQALYAAGSLTEAEYVAAKSAVLAPEGPGMDDLQRQAAVLDWEVELLRLEQDWAATAQGYRGGRGLPPSHAGAILRGLILIAAGGWLMVTSIAFGVALVLAGVVVAMLGCITASEYEEGRESFERRREELLGELERARLAVGEHRQLTLVPTLCVGTATGRSASP